MRRLFATWMQNNSNTNQNTDRDYALDNIRFILIFCVVFAHFLEVAVPFRGSTLLYKAIYSFHMPAFLFLFGYCAKFSWKRILFRWVIPYLAFQTLYILALRILTNNPPPFQYTTPYWILWYLLACIYYQLMIPVCNVSSRNLQILILLLSLFLSLVVGFVDFIEYPLTLSRFFVFLPWFLLGFYCRKNSLLLQPDISKKQRCWLGILLAGLICGSIVFWCCTELSDQVLYGSLSYSVLNYSLWIRALTILFASFWIAFLFLILKPALNRYIPFITVIGQNTLPIFLFHGFVVKALPKLCPGLLSSPWLVLLTTCLIVIFMGNRWCRQIAEWIGLCWLEKYVPFRKKQ